VEKEIGQVFKRVLMLFSKVQILYVCGKSHCLMERASLMY